MISGLAGATPKYQRRKLRFRFLSESHSATKVSDILEFIQAFEHTSSSAATCTSRLARGEDTIVAFELRILVTEDQMRTKRVELGKIRSKEIEESLL